MERMWQPVFKTNFKIKGGQLSILPAETAVQYGTLAYFTSVFGMGTGGTRLLWSSETLVIISGLYRFLLVFF